MTENLSLFVPWDAVWSTIIIHLCYASPKVSACVCVYVSYMRQNHLTHRAEFWHLPTCRLHSQTLYLHPWGQGALKPGLRGTAQTVCVRENFMKQNLKGTPENGSGQIRSQTSPWCLAAGPSARGATAAMVPWPFRLKFGREMGTHPGRSPNPVPLPGPQMGFRGPCSPNRVLQLVCMLHRVSILQQAGTLQGVWNLQRPKRDSPDIF